MRKKILFKQVVEKEFVFTEISLSLFEDFKISLKDLLSSQILFSKFSFFKYIDLTFNVRNNLLSFWKKLFQVLKKNERKIFLNSFIKGENISFTVRYFFENELEYEDFKKNVCFKT